MKVAIPTAEGRLCMHFGHCSEFIVLTVEDGQVTGRDALAPPAHAPGVLPKWLAGEGVTVVIAGGMGMRAQQLFDAAGIEVIVGAPAETPEDLVQHYLDGTLETGTNVCDH